MTEEEAKKALFEINFEYMKHTPQERINLYDDYIAKREYIKKQLAKAKQEKYNKEHNKVL